MIPYQYESVYSYRIILIHNYSHVKYRKILIMNDSNEQITSILITTANGLAFFENITDGTEWLTPSQL